MRLKSTASRNPALGDARGLFADSGAAAHRPVSAILVESGHLGQSDLADIQRYQEQHNVAFGEAAVALGKVDADTLSMASAGGSGFPLLARGDERVHPLVKAAFSTTDPDVVKVRAVRAKILSSLKRDEDSREPTLIALVGVGIADEAGILSANLGVIFAQLGSNVLLVDCGLEAPALDMLFQIPNHAGVSDHLDASPSALAAQKTAFARLWVMPAGPPSASAATNLQRQSLAKVIKQWALPSAHVIVALPDVDVASMSLGSMLEGFDSVVLVARKGETSLGDIRRVIDELDAKAVPLAGTVIG